MGVPSADPRSWRPATATSLFAAPGRGDFEACAAAGVGTIELDLFGKGAGGAAIDAATAEGTAALGEQARAAGAAGLELWSVHLPFGGRWDVSAADPERRAWAAAEDERLIREAAAWGARVAVVHASAEPVADAERAGRSAASRASLERLHRAAEAAGVRLAVECLPRTCLINRASEASDLVAAIPGLALCCDVNHLFRETPAAFIAALGPHIVTLHISDHDGLDERHWLPGRGVIDWPAVVAALAGVGYAGPFLFEVGGAVTPSELARTWERLVGGGVRAGA